MTLSTRFGYSLLRLGLGAIGTLALFHFYVHPWLTGQLSAAASQLPLGTPSLLANPAAAVQQIVGQIGPTLP